jgi:HemY protein
VARDWLLPVWERQRELSDVMRSRLLGAIESGLDSLDAAWLARIEAAQMAWPRDGQLQYLAALACMQRQLWGKAQVLMTQAVQGLQETELRRRAWRALARLAQERGDEAAQRHALEQAAGT